MLDYIRLGLVNIQRCLEQTIRQYETKIKGLDGNDLEFLNSSGKRLNNSSCSLQNTIKSSPKTFRTAKNFRAPLSAGMARPLNWGQSESGLHAWESEFWNVNLMFCVELGFTVTSDHTRLTHLSSGRTPLQKMPETEVAIRRQS